VKSRVDGDPDDELTKEDGDEGGLVGWKETELPLVQLKTKMKCSG
jgi:hypothetical protein